MTLDPWWLAGSVSPSACVAAYQPIGSESYTSSLINLANPGTYTPYPTVTNSAIAPIFNPSFGWYFNADSTFSSLTADIPLSYDQTWSMICRIDWFERLGSYPIVMGTGVSSPRFYFMIDNNENAAAFRSGTGSLDLAGKVWLSGIFCIAGRSAYVNANLEGTIPSGTSTNATTCSFGSSGAAGNKCRCKMQATAIYNTTLSQAEVNAITNAMKSLTEASLPLHHMPSAGMRRWAKLYSPQVGSAFIPAWARNSNRIITLGVMLP